MRKPAWVTEELAAYGLDAAAIPFWLLGQAEDFAVPAAFLLEMPPHYVLGRHGHPCARFEVVVKGSLHIGDGRLAGPGDVLTAPAGTLYGPHTAGPEGCMSLPGSLGPTVPG
jgi:hypothetical protein